MYVRELTRLIETQINAVRRELANLSKLGLIVESVVIEEVSETDGKKQAGVKRRYYVINKSFPLLSEMTSLIVKAQLLLETQLDRELEKLGEVRYLALLGVFIGKGKPPVDLFIVGDIDREKLQLLVSKMEKDLGTEINFSVMSPEEYKYRKDMTDKFLYAILEAPKNVLIDTMADYKQE